MSIKMKIDFDGFEGTLKAMANRVGLRSGSVLEDQAKEIMEESKQECPVDTGSLVSAAFVETHKGILKSQVTFGYDGKGIVNPKSGETVSKYMVAVHEDLEATHITGKAKFLEDPVNRYAAKFERTLGDKIKELFRRR